MPRFPPLALLLCLLPALLSAPRALGDEVEGAGMLPPGRTYGEDPRLKFANKHASHCRPYGRGEVRCAVRIDWADKYFLHLTSGMPGGYRLGKRAGIRATLEVWDSVCGLPGSLMTISNEVTDPMVLKSNDGGGAYLSVRCFEVFIKNCGGEGGSCIETFAVPDMEWWLEVRAYCYDKVLGKTCSKRD